MASLYIRLFGEPSIIRSQAGDRLPVHIGRRKAIALLAYLAVSGRRTPRTALARLLWPDFDEKSGRAEVRRALATLTAALGTGWLEADRETITLVMTPDLQIDVVEFRHCLQAADSSEDDVALALRQRAAQLAQADFLALFTLSDAPVFEQWQLLEAEQLRRELTQLLHQLSRQLATRGDPSGALEQAQRWLTLDPLHEPAHRWIMTLYAANDDPRNAMRHYRHCMRILRQELNLPPADETTALYEQIRAGRFVGSLPGGSIRKLPAHNLPAAPALLGRTMELAELASLLADPEQRLLTLTGPGGIGKSWLALQSAHQQLATHPEHWPDGLFWVSLAAVERSEQITFPILDALAIRLEGAASPQTQLIEQLRGRKLLLLLDNLEQLLDASNIVAVTELLDEILAQAPGVNVLITSRERVNLVGETVINLLGLPFPAQSDEPATMYAAVQLFVRSAQRGERNFILAEHQTAVVRICQLVQGLPLAIDLAASWVRLLSCQEIAEEIEHNLDLLTVSNPNLSPRHRSLRAVFEHSWQLLSAEQQQVLRQLAVFRGSFSREKAAEVADATLHLLASLVDKSLLQTERHAAQRRRYGLHQQVRQFAREKLNEANEAEWLHKRHSTAYLRWAEEVEPKLSAGEQGQGLALLQSEQMELHAALQWALGAGEAELAMRLGLALWRFWAMRGYLGEGRQWLEAAVQLPQPNNPTLLASLYHALGCLAYYASDLAVADRWLTGAVDLFRPLDESARLASSLLRLGMVKQERQDFATAVALHEQATQLYRRLNDENGLYSCLESSASLSYDMGEIERAEALFAESLTLARRLGDQENIATALANLGWIAVLRGDFARGLAYSREGLQHFHEMDHRFGLLFALEGVAGAIAGQQARHSVALFAATNAVREQSMMRHPPSNEKYIAQMIEPARQQLDAAAFAAAWQDGSGWSLAAAIEQARSILA